MTRQSKVYPHFVRESKHKSAAKDEHPPVPEGKLRMAITYLEMTKRPSRPHRSNRLERLSIIRSQPPTVSFYRYLYRAVGNQWLWYERNSLSDEELAKIIEDPAIEIYVLYVRGTPAGYVEFDVTVEDDVQIAYFGLTPDFIGRGLGLYFLRWAVDAAWSKEIKRLWVHTCNFDHPNAIATYQKAGFSPFKQEFKIIDDPRST